MIIPIRCFTCGKEISSKWNTYEEEVRNGKEKIVVLKELGFNRMCCRRMMLTHVQTIDKILKFDTTSY